MRTYVVNSLEASVVVRVGLMCLKKAWMDAIESKGEAKTWVEPWAVKRD